MIRQKKHHLYVTKHRLQTLVCHSQKRPGSGFFFCGYKLKISLSCHDFSIKQFSVLFLFELNCFDFNVSRLCSSMISINPRPSKKQKLDTTELSNPLVGGCVHQVQPFAYVRCEARVIDVAQPKNRICRACGVGFISDMSSQCQMCFYLQTIASRPNSRFLQSDIFVNAKHAKFYCAMSLEATITDALKDHCIPDTTRMIVEYAFDQHISSQNLIYRIDGEKQVTNYVDVKNLETDKNYALIVDCTGCRNANVCLCSNKSPSHVRCTCHGIRSKLLKLDAKTSIVIEQCICQCRCPTNSYQSMVDGVLRRCFGCGNGSEFVDLCWQATYTKSVQQLVRAKLDVSKASLRIKREHVRDDKKQQERERQILKESLAKKVCEERLTKSGHYVGRCFTCDRHRSLDHLDQCVKCAERVEDTTCKECGCLPRLCFCVESLCSCGTNKHYYHRHICSNRVAVDELSSCSRCKVVDVCELLVPKSDRRKSKIFCVSCIDTYPCLS